MKEPVSDRQKLSRRKKEVLKIAELYFYYAKLLYEIERQRGCRDYLLYELFPDANIQDELIEQKGKYWFELTNKKNLRHFAELCRDHTELIAPLEPYLGFLFETLDEDESFFGDAGVKTIGIFGECLLGVISLGDREVDFILHPHWVEVSRTLGFLGLK